MGPPEVTPPAQPPVRHPRRKWLLAIGIIALLVGLPAAWFAYDEHRADKQLREALAEMDLKGPGWRLQDLEAAQREVPEAENSALRLQTAYQLLPRNWSGTSFGRFQAEPTEQLSEQQLAIFRAELAEVQPALIEAHKVADLPWGRYPHHKGPDLLSAMLPDMSPAQTVATLLADDVLVRTQENDLAGALTSCRALLNAGRSFGEDPLAISQLVRVACASFAYRSLERTLAQGQLETAAAGTRPVDLPLLEMQKLLEDESRQPLYRIVARGERALLNGYFENIESGQISWLKVTDKKNPRWSERFGDRFLRAEPKREHLLVLQYLNRFVDLADLAPPERAVPLHQLEEEMASQAQTPGLQLLPSLSHIDQSFQRHQAQTRSMLVLIAAERYRMAHHELPRDLAALVPEFLPEVPADPYDGQPLRFQRFQDSIRIYPLGPNPSGPDAGREAAASPDLALGFRLWDVSSRRQPPKPELPSRPAPDNP